MIQRCPAENYFRYLLAHPANYSNEEVEQYAADLRLDFLGVWYLDKLRSRLSPPTPFFPEDTSHKASQRWVLKEGLEKAFLPDASMESALAVLRRPRWREVAESMLLSKADYAIVAHALRVRHRASITADGVRLFKHFFWDVDLLDSYEMRSLLDMRNTGALCTSSNDRQLAQLESLKRMRHSDPRVVAARLPHSPLAALLTQLELGIFPKKVDLAQVVDTTFAIATLRTFDAVISGGPAGAEMGKGFAAIAEIMQRLKEAVVNPEDELRNDLRKIGIATTPNQVPTLAQLTSGNHTTNVHPEPTPTVVDGSGEDIEEPDDAELPC